MTDDIRISDANGVRVITPCPDCAEDLRRSPAAGGCGCPRPSALDPYVVTDMGLRHIGVRA